jgi:hypothetical protein
MAVQTTTYPVTYSLAEPESLSRWLWLFKWLLLIPHMVVLWILSIVAMFVLFISWVVILITGKHPRGLWDFLMGFSRWSTRVMGYGLHLTDVYPPFTMDEVPDYPVQLSAEYAEDRSRLTTFFRYFLAIPHLIIVSVLNYVMWALVLVNIIVVIVTGKPQPDVFKLIVGITRWQTRSNLYVYLITDKYPPFSLD